MRSEGVKGRRRTEKRRKTEKKEEEKLGEKKYLRAVNLT